MSIYENLGKAHAAVLVDVGRGLAGVQGAGLLGQKIADVAIKAVTAGMRSANGTVTKEWSDYMSLFANNATELERLTTPKPGIDPSYFAKFRAYIVSNAVCDAATTTFTGNRIDSNIDLDFTPADMVPDPVFINARIIPIPDVTV